YFSRRSTEHVFVAKAIAMRDKPWFQSIGSGRAGDHITTLGLIREAEITNALTRVIPNVRGVHVPLSGTSSFTAYVSIGQSRPGEAKHGIPVVLGVDHYLKLVVVVDEDIDVFDESEVLWAIATRMQADRDLVVISGSLGAMLDPSADERGVTAKLGIDATRPFGEPFAEKLVMPASKMAWARELVDRLGRAQGPGRMKCYIDLSVTVDNATMSPPSTNMKLDITPHRRGPGFWQVSSVHQSLHTGAHIDSPLHVFRDGITTAEISLDQVMGEALVVDLSF